jgi:mersacidin/lichenicidin family type 2 lantibiotic
MKTNSVIRAWKDEEHRLSLSQAERALLPEHPAGVIDLTDAEMGSAAGGRPTANWLCLPPTWPIGTCQ